MNRKKYIATVLSVTMLAVNTVAGVLQPTDIQESLVQPIEKVVQVLATKTTTSSVMQLNANDVTSGSITADRIQGDFTIKATSGKKVDVDSSEQVSEYNHYFNKRIKLGGTGAADYRNITFTTTDVAHVKVYALSSSSTADRELGIYDENDILIHTLIAYGQPSLEENKIAVETVTLDTPGTYNIRSKSSGINVYYVSVTQGESESIDFNEGVAPTIDSVVLNALDSSKLDVNVSGTIPNEQTDRIVAKLYDSTGRFISSSYTNQLSSGTGVISLTPPESGDYKIICEAVREGVKEGKASTPYIYNDFIGPLEAPVIDSILTGKGASLKVDWLDVANAEKYDVSIKQKDALEYTLVATDLGDSYCEIPNLVVGETYTIKIVAYRGKEQTEVTQDKLVKGQEERFKTGLVGSGASGEMTEHEDGSVTLDVRPVGGSTGGKLADSEDGFAYYYTEIDPATENFTLRATFVVDESASKDNQSGFGIMAVDTMKIGSSADRYFNSAGTMVRKYTRTVEGALDVRYGIPGGYFVTGYTGSSDISSPTRKLIDTAPFDWDYQVDRPNNLPKFEKGDEYTLTLRKSNTGFHSTIKNSQTGEESEEIICYEPDLLLKQDASKYYVGVCASRKIKVTVKDIAFTTIHPEQDEEKVNRPATYVTPTLNMDSSTTTWQSQYEVGFKSNYKGTLTIKNVAGNVVADGVKIDPTNESDIRGKVKLNLQTGVNTFTALFTPSPKVEQGTLLGETEDFESYEPISIHFNIISKKYGTSENALYVGVNGSATNQGTKTSPLDIQTAVAYAQPGQEIVLLGGTYTLTTGINIGRGNNGTASSPIILMSEPGKKVVLDLSQCTTNGLTVNGDYWYIYDIEVCNGQPAKKPVLVTGHYNTLDKLIVHDNKDTGIQISGSAYEPKNMWPSNNLVVSCESYNNCDPQGNDADGFAAKLTVGEGNVFRYCISHHNIDDGWDLYAKSTTGIIGAVVVEQCVAYENGQLTPDKTDGKTGEGNGFKLGGENIPVEHVLRDSISFNNLARGVSSNSNPICKVYHTTAYNNDGGNLLLNTNATTIKWMVDGFISYKGKEADSIPEQVSLQSSSNYFNGINSVGTNVVDGWFKKVDTTIQPTIAQDGSIEMNGLLELTDKELGAGGILQANPNPTAITIGKEITITTGGSGSSSGGGGGSTVTTPAQVKTPNQIITDALKNKEIPRIENPQSVFSISQELVQGLIKNKQELVVKTNNAEVTMIPYLLQKQQGDSSLQKELEITVLPMDKSIFDTIKEKGLKENKLKVVGGIENTFNLALKLGEAFQNFKEPLQVTIDLSKESIKNQDKLTLVRYEKQKDGTFKPIKLGGSYDARSKKFTAQVGAVGIYSIAEAAELKKLSLAIGDNRSTVNGAIVTSDVAPELMGDITIVPLRFIAESLGAEVEWNNKAKQAIIKLDSQILTLTADDKVTVKSGRILVPLRYVSESLGANVLWIPSTKSIEIVR
ncbi:hypothetical protein CS063_15310 [Sporanaerobium hydrogeniformans]|uniref:Uncharacterized protein n=1 Tax=Sporanaerobium hydrogeniformans TaxID=3072179 RepID=A0AC61D8Y2_9FIRM|nr:copper amine oxidase N-terminal domain-containing protein [Sporanaerobium hydrogeniformans]PHV69543.1 hypothetical protein CS063_15310 [Sporanaerobium hydrogeniformans]